MTEFTFLDIVTLTLLAILTIGVWWLGLEHLGLTDYLDNRENQCPPHDWVSVYRDTTAPDANGLPQSVFDGLRCLKCKQRPGNLRGRQNTWTNGPLI